MAVEFYDVKTREKVSIDDSKIHRVTFDAANGTRYGIRGETKDGRNLNKFVSKADWDAMKYPIAESAPKEKKAPKKTKAADAKPKAEEKKAKAEDKKPKAKAKADDKKPAAKKPAAKKK
jgi:phage/plasmid primase-like uncharacterized protein